MMTESESTQVSKNAPKSVTSGLSVGGYISVLMIGAYLGIRGFRLDEQQQTALKEQIEARDANG